MTRLQEMYKAKVLPVLRQELSLNNDLEAPRIVKVAVNAGIGRLLQSTGGGKALDQVVAAVSAITGQRPVQRKARKAISAFKIREGQVVGLSVTLRGKRMYDFLDKLISVALPRTRDFRGLERRGFDGRGNYTLGIREQAVFPEQAGEESDMTFGLEVIIVTTAKDNNAGYLLLQKLGFPFKD